MDGWMDGWIDGFNIFNFQLDMGMNLGCFIVNTIYIMFKKNSKNQTRKLPKKETDIPKHKFQPKIPWFFVAPTLEIQSQ